jgi:hypothetical protein
MGGPPGIPGNPLPAEPKVPGLLELGIVPIPCTTEGEDKGVAGTIPPEGSSPFCRLSEDGFCGFAGDGLVCASAKETQTVRATGRVSRTTRVIESSPIRYRLTGCERKMDQPKLMVREAGIEPARHC